MSTCARFLIFVERGGESREGKVERESERKRERREKEEDRLE